MKVSLDGFGKKACKGEKNEYLVALWSSGRHLVSGSEGPGFKSWLCQVDVESLGKTLYMHLKRQLLCNAPQGVEKGTVVGMACRGPYVKRLEHYINALFNFILENCWRSCSAR